MRLIWRFVLTTTLIIAGGYHTSVAAGFSYKAGLGYDFLSQEYFLDSAAQSDADSVLTEWSLKTDYLDDLKGMFSLTFLPTDDRSVQLTSRYEQTSDFLRVRFLGDARAKLGESRLDFIGELDWRDRYHGEASFGDSYVFGYSRTKLSIPTGKDVKSVFEIHGEFVEFDSTSATSFNYYRVGGKAGLEKFFENFSFGNIDLSFSTRQVPDSSALNYVDFGLESSAFGFYSQGEFDYFARVGRKDYNMIDGRNDFWRWELDGRNKIRLGERYFTKQDLDFELTNYDPNDPVNLDYYRLELTLLTGYETVRYSFGVGPQFEALHEAKDDFVISEDYFEIGAVVDFDYIKAGKLFVAVESVLGTRDLKDNNELLSDYTFERLNVIADVKFLKHLTFNVLFSAEWEWHTVETNNSEIFLLSSSLVFGI